MRFVGIKYVVGQCNKLIDCKEMWISRKNMCNKHDYVDNEEKFWYYSEQEVFSFVQNVRR